MATRAISGCCQVSLLRGRSRCSWCSSDLAALIAPEAAGVAAQPGTRAVQLALRRTWIRQCLRGALTAPVLRSGRFSADDLRVLCPLSRVAITRQLHAWAAAREDLDGLVVAPAGAVALGAGRSCVLWRLQPRAATAPPA